MRFSLTTHLNDMQYSEENESNARGYVRKFPMSIKSAKGTRITGKYCLMRVCCNWTDQPVWLV